MTTSTLRRFAPIIALAVLAAILINAGLAERLSPQTLIGGAGHALAWAAANPVATFAALAGTIALTTAVGLPGAVAVFAAAGFLLGVPAAMAAAAAGNLAGTSILFFALRHAFFQPADSNLPDAGAMQRIRAGFTRNPLAYALFLRALPILPNGAATAVLAMVRCPWPIFLTASALGPQGNAALMGWLGAQFAADLASGRAINLDTLADPRWWLPLAALAALTLLPIALRRCMAGGGVAKP